VRGQSCHPLTLSSPQCQQRLNALSQSSVAPDRFGDDDQRRLEGFFADLDARSGTRLMLSNSDPKKNDPNNYFFDDLYARFKVQRVAASRMINSVAGGRGKITEILVTNNLHSAR
jgi:DNA adenine methylase